MAGFASAPALRAAPRVRVGKVAAVPPTKELRELSDADIEERVAKAKRRLLDLRIKKATRQELATMLQEFKPHEFAENKKEVRHTSVANSYRPANTRSPPLRV
eukprot:jgi/Pico_ML_1/51399/g206.t1